MGLFAIFGKRSLSPEKINKIAKLAANPFAQPDVRMREMQRLLAEGSELSLCGVVKRFASNASSHIADEDEKQWLEDRLVEVGEPALAPLAAYVGTQKHLSYALRAYRRIAGDDATVDLMLATLKKYGPDDYRASEAKHQLVLELMPHRAHPRVLRELVAFLGDHTDEVRFAVMDLIESAARNGTLAGETLSLAVEQLGAIVLHDDNRPRIEQRAAALLCTYGWQIGGEGTALPPLLDAEFFIDKKRFVRRRATLRQG